MLRWGGEGRYGHWIGPFRSSWTAESDAWSSRRRSFLRPFNFEEREDLPQGRERPLEAGHVEGGGISRNSGAGGRRPRSSRYQSRKRRSISRALAAGNSRRRFCRIISSAAANRSSVNATRFSSSGSRSDCTSGILSLLKLLEGPWREVELVPRPEAAPPGGCDWRLLDSRNRPSDGVQSRFLEAAQSSGPRRIRL